LHLPLTTLSVPAHRNARRRLFTWLMAHIERQHVMDTCTGIYG
jgi:hypothetical protein